MLLPVPCGRQGRSHTSCLLMMTMNDSLNIVPPLRKEPFKEGWYAGVVKYCCERSSQEKISLLGMEIETYVPVKKVMRQYSDRCKLKEVVVITNIVFFRADTQEQFVAVRNQSYISYILKNPGEKRPSPIPLHEFERMRRFIDGAQGDITLETLDHSYTVGSEVYVFQGPLQGQLVRVVQEVDKKAKIGVDIQLLGTLCTFVDVGDIMPKEKWEKLNDPFKQP